jgi:hypothetical protein
MTGKAFCETENQIERQLLHSANPPLNPKVENERKR